MKETADGTPPSGGATPLGSVRREVRELSLLFEISQILDSAIDLREVVQQVLIAISNHMGMSRGTLALLNRDTREVMIETAHGLSNSQKERGRYKLGEGIEKQESDFAAEVAAASGKK